LQRETDVYEDDELCRRKAYVGIGKMFWEIEKREKIPVFQSNSFILYFPY
jgi:hypothetical protein